MKSSQFWPYKVDHYDLFTLLVSNPRIPKIRISKHFGVNAKTGELWLEAAVRKRVLIPPVVRKRSFVNLREYFTFLRTRNPHEVYEGLKGRPDISYFSVQTGFANLQIISKNPLEFNKDTVLSGPRSDYYVTIPQRISTESSVKQIEKKTRSITTDGEKFSRILSPLIFHDTAYDWDELDELFYRELSDDLRKPLGRVLKKTGSYRNRMWNWIKTRDIFGQTIIMYFPQGESSYLLSQYYIDTNYDSLMIDIFSSLPTSTVFYRVGDRLIVNLYLPFLANSEKPRSIVKETLEVLCKKELVQGYTNSIVEYHYRN